MTITKGRLKTLWTIARQVMELYPDIIADESDFRDWLHERTGRRSTRALTIRQADQVIDGLKAMLSSGRGLITWGQQQKIKALRELLDWDRPRLWGFIHRQLKINKSEYMLLKSEATKTIIGLQRVIAGGDRQLYDYLNRAAAKTLFSDRGRLHVQSLKQKPKSGPHK